MLNDDRWLSELDEYVDIAKGVTRTLDWHDDIVMLNDCKRIRELRVYAPPHGRSPIGCVGTLRTREPSCMFVISGRIANVFAGEKHITYQLIGKVTNKNNGQCECFIWDNVMQAFSEPYLTSVFDFKPWASHVGLRGRLNLEHLGLEL